MGFETARSRRIKSNSPLNFSPGFQVSVPVPLHLHSSNMAATCTLVPAPTPHSARRWFAVASSSMAARNLSILDRVRSHNRWWNLCSRNKERIVGWYHCSCVEDLECGPPVHSEACFDLKRISNNISLKKCVTYDVIKIKNPE